MTTLGDLAAVIRSKNAGPFMVTVDVFFATQREFDRVKQSGVLEAPRVAAAHGVAVNEVVGPYWEPRALGVKVSVVKRAPAGVLACTDVFGSHQHIVLAQAVVE